MDKPALYIEESMYCGGAMKKKIILAVMWLMLLIAAGVLFFVYWDYRKQEKNSRENSSEVQEIVSISGETGQGTEESGKKKETATSGNAARGDTATGSDAARQEKDPEVFTAELAYPLAKPWTYSILKPEKTKDTTILRDPESVMKEAEAKQKEELAELEAKGELPPEEEIPVITIYNPLPLEPKKAPSHPVGEDEDYFNYKTVYSTNLIMVDADTGEIVVERGADERIYPASMIKILTVLVAADYIHDWEDTYVIRGDLIDYAYANQCSCVGFLRDETVTVRDLFYGTIVCSGADACLSLADYCCGSPKEFVRRMNLKLEELGIADTAHVTNCVGIHEETQYCTVKDMAIIMGAAMQNPFVMDALAQLYYTVPPDDMVPDGIQIANAFMCRVEDEVPGAEVKGAKTGYSPQIGFNAASWLETEDGRRYICITVNCDSTWRSVYDHIALYRNFT